MEKDASVGPCLGLFLLCVNVDESLARFDIVAATCTVGSSSPRVTSRFVSASASLTRTPVARSSTAKSRRSRLRGRPPRAFAASGRTRSASRTRRSRRASSTLSAFTSPFFLDSRRPPFKNSGLSLRARRRRRATARGRHGPVKGRGRPSPTAPRKHRRPRESVRRAGGHRWRR